MKTELVSLTPKMAREWLKRNTNNRPLRPSHVETLRLSFERGEYVTTHQGVAFDETGVMIDGQHRVAAIAALEDGSFPMLVTRGLDRSEAFPVIDATQAKRSTSDVLGIERSEGECANFLAKLYQGFGNGLTPTYVKPFAEWVRPELADLLAFCHTSAKTWSSAPVRSAAVVMMKTSDPDYAKLLYRAMVLSDYGSMPPIAQALCRAWQNGTVRAGAGLDLFCRCLKLFNPANANNKKIQINDTSKVSASVRQYLDGEVFGKKKPASFTRAGNGAKSNYRIEGL